MITKMKPVDPKTGEAAAASPSSSTARRSSPATRARARARSAAGSSNNDWLEAIVALPDQLFYNTGISTYIWIVTNRKPERRRKGKVQLINATEMFQKMRKSLGNKRNEICEGQRSDITRHYGTPKIGEHAPDLRQRGLRLPPDHRRAAAPAELPGLARAHRAPSTRRAPSRPREAEEEGPRREPEIEEGPKLQQRHPRPLAAIDATTASGRTATRSRRAATGRLKKADARRCLRRSGRPSSSALSRARRDGRALHRREGRARARPRPARQRERAAEGGHRRPTSSGRCCPTCPTPGSTRAKTKIGYEIPFTRHFYKYTPLRPLCRDRRRDPRRWRRRSVDARRGTNVANVPVRRCYRRNMGRLPRASCDAARTRRALRPRRRSRYRFSG